MWNLEKKMENEGLHVHSSQQTEEAGIHHVFIKIPAKDVGMGTTQGLHQCPISMSLFIPGPIRTRPPAVLDLKMNLLQSAEWPRCASPPCFVLPGPGSFLATPARREPGYVVLLVWPGQKSKPWNSISDALLALLRNV